MASIGSPVTGGGPLPGSRHARGNRFRLLAVAVSAVVIVALAGAAAVSANTALVALGVLTAVVVLAALPKTGAAYLMAFVLLLFLIPSTLTVKGPLNAIGQPSTILGWGAGILWLLGRLQPETGLDRGRNPARWITLFFVTVLILAFGVAYTRPLTHLEIQGTYRSVAKLSAYVGMGLLTMDSLKSRKEIDLLLKTIVLGATFSAVIGLIQFRTGFTYVDKIHFPGLTVFKGLNAGGASTRQGLHRVTGTAHHPIEYAVTLCVSLPLALHYSLHLAKSKMRLLMRVCAVLLAVAVPTSISRTGAVSIVLAVLVVSLDWSWRQRANLAALAVAAATVVAVAVPRLLGTVRGLFAGLSGKDSINHRTKAYTNLQPFLHGHLLLGRGQGTFQQQQYFTLDDQYLGTLLAAGIIGVISLVLLYLNIVFLGRGARKRGRDQVDRSLGQALTAGGVVLAFSAATFDLFGFTQALALTFLLVGVTGAFWRITWNERQAAEAEALSALAAGEPVATA